MTRARVCLVVAGVVLAAASCSSGGGEPEVECTEASPELAAQIAEGANGAAITPVETATVQYDDDLWLVPMSFTIEGIDDTVETGVWAVTTPDAGGGLTMSVDGFAQEFTDWPQAPSPANGSEEVLDAKTCVEE
ncbi:hypothetical protein [Cellulosimicrobium sp. Marseille-Q8652]